MAHIRKILEIKNQFIVFKFLTNKPLWVNIVFAFLLGVVLILLVLSSLNFFTKHGQILKIPSVTGKSFNEAKKILEQQGFDVEIQDSVFRDTVAPLTVLRQFPEADEVVKVNRTVYLTINRSVPPNIVMPNLVGMSFRNAEIVIKQFGFKLGDTTYKPDFAKNSVLNQLVNNKDVQPGTKLPMGSSISLILGSGLSDVDLAVPDLVGMKYTDAKTMIDAAGVNFGAKVVDPDVHDTLNAYIYRQSPERYTEDKRMNRIRAGQMIDIWLSVQQPSKDSTDASNEATHY